MNDNTRKIKMLCIVPYSSEGASNRYRVEQYIDFYKDAGIDCVISPFVDSKFYSILYKEGNLFFKAVYFFKGVCRRIKDIFRAAVSDIVFIHREACPFGPPVFERIFSLLRKPIVYDFDDAIYLPNYDPANSTYSFFKCPGKTKKIIRLSSYVIVANNFLKEFALKYNPDVEVIPTCVDVAKLQVKKPGVSSSPLVIGWIGTKTTAPYLELLYPVLTRLAEKYDFVFRVVGAGRDINIDGVEVENIPWSLDTEWEHFTCLDIGVYPLIENEWASGKAAFKAILYMCAGVPTVASAVGMNKDVVCDGVNGFLAGTADDWYERLSQLIEDRQLRERFARAGREAAERKFSVQVRANEYINIIRAALNGEKISDKINLFHLITDLNIGGTPIVLGSLVSRLNNDDFNLCVGSLKTRAKESIAEQIEKDNIPVVFFDAYHLNMPLVFWRLYLFLKDYKIDILHTWLFHSNFLGRLCGKLAGVKVIISSERAIDLKKGRFRVFLDRITSGLCDLIIANADAVKNMLVKREKIKADKIKVIKNGLDFSKFNKRIFSDLVKGYYGIGNDDIVISTVARLHPVKGHMFLIDAVKRLLPDYPAIKLLIVGEGDYRRNIERKIEREGLSDNVIFTGLNRDVAALLNITDIFVLASIEEGFPGSVLEAMAMHKPVVASSVGGIIEIIDNEKEGLLVSPGNVSQLAAALKRLIEDKEFAVSLADRGCRKVSEYSIDWMISKTAKVYSDLCASEKACAECTGSRRQKRIEELTEVI